MPLIEGEAFERLLASVERTTLESIARMREEGRRPPQIRLDEWLAAQPAPAAGAVRALLGARRWRTVMFPEFAERLRGLAAPLLGELAAWAAARPGRRACFFVDDLHKSSFWVTVLALTLAPEARAALVGAGRPGCLAVGGGDLAEALAALPAGGGTRVVAMDDAAYSGEQLSATCAALRRRWREAHAGAGGRVLPLTVCVPYMSAPSVRLFKARGTRVLCGERFPSLLHRRPVAAVLAADLVLERRSPRSSFGSRYDSLFFDFVGVRPGNTLLLLQHKFADALSIPYRWLHAGRCLRPGVDATHAWRVRPGRVAELARMLEREVRDERGFEGGLLADGPGGGDDAPPLALRRGPVHGEVAQRLCEYMHSPPFRARFMQEVELGAASAPAPPPAVPLLPPEYCSEGYQRFVRERLRADGGRGLVHIPECFKAPYKRSSYRRRASLRRVWPA